MGEADAVERLEDQGYFSTHGGDVLYPQYVLKSDTGEEPGLFAERSQRLGRALEVSERLDEHASAGTVRLSKLAFAHIGVPCAIPTHELELRRGHFPLTQH